MVFPRALSLVPFFSTFFISDMFLSLDQGKPYNYADKNTIWIEGTDKEGISTKLEQEMNIMKVSSQTMLKNVVSM